MSSVGFGYRNRSHPATMVTTPMTAAGVSPRNTAAVTMARKLLEIFTRLVGVSTAVRSPTTDAVSRMPKSGRFQSESRFAHTASPQAPASAANSSAMTLLLGRPGMSSPYQESLEFRSLSGRSACRDAPRLGRIRRLAHRAHELVQIVGREPALASRRPIHLDEPLVRPLAEGGGAYADVLGGLTYVQQSTRCCLHHLEP